jgi:hypothetical protein
MYEEFFDSMYAVNIYIYFILPIYTCLSPLQSNIVCVSVLKSLLTVSAMNKYNLALQLKEMLCVSGQDIEQAVTVWLTPWNKPVCVTFHKQYDRLSEHK